MCDESDSNSNFDGGRILMTVLEVITGRRDEKLESIVLTISMILVLGLFILITISDIESCSIKMKNKKDYQKLFLSEKNRMSKLSFVWFYGFLSFNITFRTDIHICCLSKTS